MKLNNLSRLTALLLALMMLPLAVFAESGTSTGDLTGAMLANMNNASLMIEEGYCETCANNVASAGLTAWPVTGYTCLYEHLADLSPSAAYDMLIAYYSANTAEGDALWEAYRNSHNDHVTNAANAGSTEYPTVMCDCAQPVLQPGNGEHDATCPWADEEYVPSTETTVEGLNSALAISVPATAFPEGTAMSVNTVSDTTTLDAVDSAILAAVKGDADFVMGTTERLDSYDITFTDANGEKVQPAEGSPVTLKFTVPTTEDMSSLSVYHLVKTDGGYVAELVDSFGIDSDLSEQVVSIQGINFSIYAVIGTYSNNWNYNNYKILLTVGDEMQIATSTSGNTYAWSIYEGDTTSFSLTNQTSQTSTLTATSAGTIRLRCEITPRQGSSTTEYMTIEALPSIGSSVDDDIIFANIDKEYTSGDTEYENTYGPYVMKIRFEDDEGNVLKYANGTTVGEDYYVFDSLCNIDVNTFATSAPDGYTYAGAFFYWSGHFTGDKVYVTSVERRNNNTAYGSHLYYGGTHSTSGQGSWAYQPSGVLHVVYAPIDEVHTVIFKDHCGYELANYALPHNDRAVTFPTGYVGNIDNMASNLIPNHHSNHDEGYVFKNTWVVTGGGNGIDGTYTTTQLKTNITLWNIQSNITITAECYVPYGELKITKTGMESGESAIFDINVTNPSGTEATYTVVLSGPNASVTLSQLLVGSTYEVSEQSGWSWSYERISSSGTSGTIEANNPKECTFANKKNDQWLHDESGIINIFGNSQAQEVN